MRLEELVLEVLVFGKLNTHPFLFENTYCCIQNFYIQ